MRPPLIQVLPAVSQALPQKVEVVVLAEAGCPPCMAFVRGQLTDLVAAEGLSDIIDLQHVPFGNAYFATEACGHGSVYNRTERLCWTKTCVESESPVADCFEGPVVWQHGALEGKVNRMQACAKSIAADWQTYFPFVRCTEDHYAAEGVDAAQECAGDAHIDADALMQCYMGPDGDAAVVREAKRTPDHAGTPQVTINGQILNDLNKLLSTVCAAYSGEKPVGCSPIDVQVVAAASDHDFLLGTVDAMVKAEGVADIISLLDFSWGNNYYATQACGGEPYSDEKRRCWWDRCNSGSSTTPSDCVIAAMSGAASIVTENTTEKEVAVLTSLVCAKSLAVTWKSNWQFVTCMMNAYEAAGADVLQYCSSIAGMNYFRVQSCIESPAQLIYESMHTPDHDKVPYVMVNGQKVNDTSSILQAVCAAYPGTAPKGCELSGVMLV